MKLSATLLIVSLLLAVRAGNASAAEVDSIYSVENVPNVRLQDSRQYVSDPTAILSASARDTINALLYNLESSTGIETAVVVLPSIGESDIFDFSHNLFRSWGIGKEKNNNGLLILYVGDIRKIRFTTGYGLEGTMTDAMAKRIQTQVMVPAFRQGLTDEGMVEGVRAACAVLDGTMEAEKTGRSQGVSPWLSALILIVLFVIGVLLLRHNNKKTLTCDYCKKSSLRKMSSDVYTGKNGHRYKKDIYICGNCGKLSVRTTDLGGNDNGGGAIMGGILGGIMLGSIFRGRHHGGFGGGGGFSGGSFGGGSTGGGGSTSGW